MKTFQVKILYSKKGCKVVIASRNSERLNKAAEELSKVGTVTPITCNIRHEDQVKLVSSPLPCCFNCKLIFKNYN